MKIARKWLRFACALVCVAPVLVNAQDDDDGDRRHHRGSSSFTIEVLSTKPYMVSGGDALVRVTVKKKNVQLSDVRVELNRADITGSFKADRKSGRLSPVTKASDQISLLGY